MNLVLATAPSTLGCLPVSRILSPVYLLDTKRVSGNGTTTSECEIALCCETYLTGSVPFAPHVRKQVLAALEDHIIPALQVGFVPQILVAPPYDFSTLACQVERRKLLTHKVHSPLQMVRHWKQEKMVATSALVFSFVYEGASYERIGVTTVQAKQVKAPHASLAGVTQVRMEAPSLICYPPCSLHGDGTAPVAGLAETTSVLCLHLTPQEMRVFISKRTPTLRQGTHNLQISDPLLVQMGQIYEDELCQDSSSPGAQGQLLAFMCRLKRYVELHKPGLTNSCWLDPSEVNRKIDASANPRHQQLCREIVEYIHHHLHLNLTLTMLAARFGFSEFHLNCIFKDVVGTTVVQYVARQRIETAKFMMADTGERVSDIAQLTGFASAASFCKVFRKHTGQSPNEYRRAVKQSDL